MNNGVYTRLAYDLTWFPEQLPNPIPGHDLLLRFGGRHRQHEKGGSMWARVKGRTENHILALPFRQAYMFRPGLIKPIPGLKHTYRI